MTVSACVLTGGTHLPRLAAILDLLRPVVSEVVVAVDDRRAAEAQSVLGGRADRLLTFPFAEPSDRPIPWLFENCSGEWIFNIDDDEVPGVELLAELPRLVGRDDVTHCWIRRRWLYPGVERYLAEPPWSTEFQLRLFLNDRRTLQFSDAFHRPVVCTGPMCFVAAPLWHLDTAVNDHACRTAKALRYERARPGMRIGALSHNTGLYVPELRGAVRTAPVPDEDMVLIRSVIQGAADVSRRRGVQPEKAMRADVDRPWPGEPYSDGLYRARLSLVDDVPTECVAGVDQTVDVLVENLGDEVWRWGTNAAPDIRIGARWPHAAGTELRTSLPADIPPGATALVPVHILPPPTHGRRRLEIDLVHEHVRWFDCGVSLEIDIRPRRRIAVSGSPEGVSEALDVLALSPEIEIAILDRGAPTDGWFDHRRVRGLHTRALDDASRFELIAQLGRVVFAARVGQGTTPQMRESLDVLRESEALIVAGLDWPEEARPRREALRMAATVVASRSVGTPVLAIRGTCHPLVERLATHVVDLDGVKRHLHPFVTPAR